MTTENFKDKVFSILTHENQKLRKRFSTVEEYLSYKVKAHTLVSNITNVLFEPYVFKGFADAIENDAPYFHAIHFFKLNTSYGQRIADYNLEMAELALEAGFILTGGAIVFEESTIDDIKIFFTYVDPEKVDDALTNLKNQFDSAAPVPSGEATPVDMSLN